MKMTELVESLCQLAASVIYRKAELRRMVMVPTANEILFLRTFPRQSIHDLKAINQDTCERAYRIYSIYDQ